MKRVFILFFLCSFVFANQTYSQDSTFVRYVPCENQFTFSDAKQSYIYQEHDSIYVSLAFIGSRRGEYIFDLIIDNQSSVPLEFDPDQIHLFRYENDTLAEQKIYHPLNAGLVLDSIDASIETQKRKIRNKSAMSIFAWMLYFTAALATESGEMDYNTMDLIDLTHDAVQTGIAVGKEVNTNHIDNLCFDGDYWSNAVMTQDLIFPYSSDRGHIHFRVKTTQLFKIEIPIGDRIFRYRFKQNQENETI